MIVILQLARRLSECVACPLCPFVLSLALVSVLVLCSFSLFHPLSPMCILRGYMPAHPAAQRRANQTGQPAVRILIKLCVTPE